MGFKITSGLVSYMLEFDDEIHKHLWSSKSLGGLSNVMQVEDGSQNHQKFIMYTA